MGTAIQNPPQADHPSVVTEHFILNDVTFYSVAVICGGQRLRPNAAGRRGTRDTGGGVGALLLPGPRARGPGRSKNSSFFGSRADSAQQAVQAKPVLGVSQRL